MERLAKSNGGAALISGADNSYLFDASEIQVEISLGKGMILTHVFGKPSLQDHLDRERAIRRISKIANNNEITTDTNESEANAEFYNSLILRARIHKIGVAGQDLEYDADQCRAFRFETKNKAVTKMYAGWFEVEESDDPVAVLFEREGTMIVRQDIGEEDPSYSLRYTIQIPSKTQRQEYITSSIQVKRKTEKRRTTLETVFNLNKGVKLFAALFQGVEGGRIQAGSYVPELRAEFLAAIDPVFQNSVVDAAVGFFDKALD